MAGLLALLFVVKSGKEKDYKSKTLDLRLHGMVGGTIGKGKRDEFGRTHATYVDAPILAVEKCRSIMIILIAKTAVEIAFEGGYVLAVTWRQDWPLMIPISYGPSLTILSVSLPALRINLGISEPEEGHARKSR
jgi:hypothetical protein